LKAFVIFLFVSTSLCTLRADEITIKQRSHAGQAVYMEALNRLEQHDYKAAADGFRQAADLSPDWSKPWLGLAQVAMDQGKVSEAAIALRKASAVSPKNPEVTRAWGRYYVSTKNTPQAEASFKQAIQLAPQWALPCIDAGDLFAFQGRIDQAIAMYRQAIVLEPDHAGARFALGNMLAKQGKWADAQKEFESALRITPNSLLATEGLAGTYIAQRQPANAEKLYQSTLKTEPNSANLHLAFGDLLLSENKLQDALKQFQTATYLDPKFPAAYAHLGICYEMLKDSADAERAYRSALAISRDDPMTLNNLAWLFVTDNRNLDEAIGFAKRATEVAPKVWLYSETLGWAYRSKGDRQQAIAALKKAATLNLKNATAWYRLGIAYQESGQVGLASSSFAKALHLNSQFESATDAKVRLAQLRLKPVRQ